MCIRKRYVLIAELVQHGHNSGQVSLAERQNRMMSQSLDEPQKLNRSEPIVAPQEPA